MTYLVLRAQLDDLLADQLDHVSRNLVTRALERGDFQEARSAAKMGRTLEGRCWVPVIQTLDKILALATY